MTNSNNPGGVSVLVAEDDQVMSDVIRFNLERGGYQVRVARNGLNAWQLLQDHHFDVAILDYQMPGLTGEQVCRKVRDELENHTLRVIFLTARGLELNAMQLKTDLQIEKVLFKPFSPRELLETVANAVRLVAAR